jgi:EAL domain-containing protein (putative c-di-GMP-specific phosphodiesterase class I)
MPANPIGDRLLIVDDEPGFANVVKRVAEGVGFEVVVAEDPEGFIKTARYWRPAVIILDLRMPGRDGVEVLRSLAADDCAATVVLVSGEDAKTLEASAALGRERGLKMSSVLPKPFRMEALRQLLLQFKPLPKMLVSAELAHAIASGDLFLEYQPKLDCRLGQITGVEALVRWRHPERGIIPPDQFIAVAEESSLMHRLTDWVVATASKQGATWRTVGLGLEIAVNVSIEDLELPDRLSDRCHRNGLDPSCIILELTETGAMREPMQMMDVLTRLRLKGFRLAIDDFGTGYSSLVQLQKLPFSEIKIDRTFTMQMMQNEACRTIVEIVVDLARRLRLRSVAEGVEDKATLKTLIGIGCGAAQGFYISRPLPADRVPGFIREAASAKTLSAA